MADKKTTPGKPEKVHEQVQASQPEPAKKAQMQKNVPLPLMIDFSLSVSRLMVLLVGLMTAMVSIFSGATIPMTALRSGSATLSIGIIVWAFNWLLSRNSLEVARLELLREIEATKSQESDIASTVEISA